MNTARNKKGAWTEIAVAIAISKIAFAFAGLSLVSGCTEQLPRSFRFKQQEQSFSSQQEINTKIDLLWVVDNSASMDVSQSRLRKGFASFAQKYLQPTWDIRVAVITTDAYLAHSAFQPYLNTVVSGSVGWASPYILTRLASFVNPSYNPSLVNLTTGVFTNGIKYGEIIPSWGANYAKLLAGYHDGPIAALCFEGMPYFLRGVSQCQVRDAQGANTGASHCLSPSGSESSISQCVNTIQNNTIHSGKPIIVTKPPAGVAGDAAWTQQLINDFTINVSVGSAGQGSERGLGSLQQMLADNEPSESAFFRKGSLRGIIFVSDEEDQTMTIPANPPAGFNPRTFYKCDQASLLGMNAAAAITGNNGFCCNDPTKNCSFGLTGGTNPLSCAPKTIDGFTYTVSTCAREDMLVPVADVKGQVDTFFQTLDGTTNANYFVVAIVPTTAAAVQALQAAHEVDDQAVGTLKTVSTDRGDRYIDFANQVGNGSLALNIGEEDYSPVLEAIGKSIVEKKSTFQLTREPTGSEEMLIQVVHADGSATRVKAEQYVIQGKSIVVTDSAFILSLASTDKMTISYQPKTAY